MLNLNFISLSKFSRYETENCPGSVRKTNHKFRPDTWSSYKWNTVMSFGHSALHSVLSGNHYGTPKPPRDPKDSAKDGPLPRDSSFPLASTAATPSSGLPGQHPSSEGKRKRNRSTIEATNRSPISRPDGRPPSPPTTGGRKDPDSDSLGPLPSNWEMAFTDDGTPYFIE